MEVSYYKSLEPFWGSWRIKRLLGEGAFGKVFEVVREDFGTFNAALKIITIPQSESEWQSIIADGMDDVSATTYFEGFVKEITSEIGVMSRLKGHRNIVYYEDHSVLGHADGRGWDILIRMELLTPFITTIPNDRSMDRDKVIQLGIDMCNALEYCHAKHIIHRDIKPENIFVSDAGDYKLGDFGIARTVEKTMGAMSRKGTYTYMAPEVFKGEEYDATVDIYSLGIVLYRLLNRNRAPFLPPYPTPLRHSDKEEALNKRLMGETIPLPIDAQDELGEIILKACAYNSRDRFRNLAEMRRALENICTEQSSEYSEPTEMLTEAILSRFKSAIKNPNEDSSFISESDALPQADEENDQDSLTSTSDENPEVPYSEISDGEQTQFIFTGISENNGDGEYGEVTSRKLGEPDDLEGTTEDDINGLDTEDIDQDEEADKEEKKSKKGLIIGIFGIALIVLGVIFIKIKNSNNLSQYMSVDPGTKFFKMDTSLFGVSYEEFKEKIGISNLDELQVWTWWGEGLEVVWVGNGFGCFFNKYDKLVAVMYDYNFDKYDHNSSYFAAKSEYGDSLTLPIGVDGYVVNYWYINNSYYVQNIENYNNTNYFRQIYYFYDVGYLKRFSTN